MDIIQDVLIYQTQMMRNSSLGPYVPPDFSPPEYIVVVNALFYASLVVMIMAAFIAMLIKSWVREFDRGLRVISIPEQRATTREFRYLGMERWKLPEMVAVLPLLIQLSLLLFSIGLVLFLFHISTPSFGITTVILGVGVLYYAITTSIPIFVTSSPSTLLIPPAAQPPADQFTFCNEDEDTLHDIPVITSQNIQPAGCGLCGGGHPSPTSEDIHPRPTSAEAATIDPHSARLQPSSSPTPTTRAKSLSESQPLTQPLPSPDLCVPNQHNHFSNNGNIPYDLIRASTSTSPSSGSSLTSPHPAASRLPHSPHGSYSTFSSVSARSSPSAPPQHLTSLPPPQPSIIGASLPMEAIGFTLPPAFDSRDPFHPLHSQSGLQDALLFDGPSAIRPKLPSAIPASTPPYLSHSRSSSYGQTPTVTTYQAPFPFQPHNVDHRGEWGVPQRPHAPAASSPPKIDTSKVIQVPPAARELVRENPQSQRHHLGHTPLGEKPKQYFVLPIRASTADVLGPAVATDNTNKLNFRAAALTANPTTAARAHLAAHNWSQSMVVGSGVNGPAVAPPTTHGYARSSSVVVVGSNNTNASANNHPNADTNGSNMGNVGHKRGKSSASSTHSLKSVSAAENQKPYAFDPHRGPRSTDWMHSPETLATRPTKDARFAQMVALGLAKGRTKAGWAQARRPGKRDRDAAKRKLAEEMAGRQADPGPHGEGATDIPVEEGAGDMESMAVVGAA